MQFWKCAVVSMLLIVTSAADFKEERKCSSVVKVVNEDYQLALTCPNGDNVLTSDERTSSFAVANQNGDDLIGKTYEYVKTLKGDYYDNWVKVLEDVMKTDPTNVVKYYGKSGVSSLGDIFLGMIFENPTQGSLVNYYLANTEKFKDPRIIMQFALDIIKGIKSLHKKEWVHTNISVNTIMVTRNNVAKISNLGHAVKYDQKVSLQKRAPNTPPYQTINTSNFAIYNDDIFGFGVVLYAMVTGENPFDWKTQRYDDNNRYLGNIKVSIEIERSVALLLLKCLNWKQALPKLDDLISFIETYLESKEDVIIELKNPDVLSSTKKYEDATPIRTVNREEASNKFKAERRFQRRALAEVARVAI